jgi:ribose transport system substrate-binding protein
MYLTEPRLFLDYALRNLFAFPQQFCDWKQPGWSMDARRAVDWSRRLEERNCDHSIVSPDPFPIPNNDTELINRIKANITALMKPPGLPHHNSPARWKTTPILSWYHKIFLSICLVLCSTLPALCQTKELKSVALLLQDLGNPYYTQVVHGTEQKAKEFNPAVKFVALSCNNDLGTQTNQMDDAVGGGANLIILSAADPEGIEPAVNRAKASGVTVVAVDNGAKGVDATVTSNNVQAGEVACQYIVDRLKGHGQVVIVSGISATAVFDRVAGAMKVFNQHPDIKILSKDQNSLGTRDGGLRVMTDLLTAFPKIDAVFAINDPAAIGSDLAARQAQRKDLFVVGVDGSPDAVNALKEPGSLFAATAAQDPFAMAQKATQIGYEIMNGKPPESKTILIPVTLVTREDVSKFQGWTK